MVFAAELAGLLYRDQVSGVTDNAEQIVAAPRIPADVTDFLIRKIVADTAVADPQLDFCDRF
jgi:hypothetical protein